MNGLPRHVWILKSDERKTLKHVKRFSVYQLWLSWDSTWISYWPWTHSGLTDSASSVLGLKVWATMARQIVFLLIVNTGPSLGIISDILMLHRVSVILWLGRTWRGCGMFLETMGPYSEPKSHRTWQILLHGSRFRGKLEERHYGISLPKEGKLLGSGIHQGYPWVGAYRGHCMILCVWRLDCLE